MRSLLDNPRPCVVVNENTLAYLLSDTWAGVLRGSVLRGGRGCIDGPFPISGLDVVRPATLADFEAYRVSPKGHLPCAG